MSYIDKSRCKEQIEMIRKIWEHRDICIVEGDKTRSGIGNNIFENSMSIKRVICPSENAFELYTEILYTIKSKINKNTLVLISLGMTATVLAYDLAKLGYQAIDLGHLDVEYEWFLRKSTWKSAIPGKYVNEVEGGSNVQEITNIDYEKQVVAKICK